MAVTKQITVHCDTIIFIHKAQGNNKLVQVKTGSFGPATDKPSHNYKADIQFQA